MKFSRRGLFGSLFDAAAGSKVAPPDPPAEPAPKAEEYVFVAGAYQAGGLRAWLPDTPMEIGVIRYPQPHLGIIKW